MRWQKLILLLAWLLLAALMIQAQDDYETVYNPRTGNIEVRHNPWNQDKLMREKIDRDRQLNDLIRANRNRQSQDNARDSQALSITLYNAAVRRVNQGKARIKAGRASTAFVDNPDFSLASYLTQKAETPALKQKVQKFAEAALKHFKEELRAKGLAANDLADGGALAFVLCHEVYFGVQPSEAQFQWLRRKLRQELMADAKFQGGSDQERQRNFSVNGALTMYAIDIYRKGATVPLTERKEAKEIAAEVLQIIWGNSIDTILMTPTGFMHKGEKIIAGGGATHLYNYNSNVQTAVRYARNIQVQGVAQTYQEYLTLFYQELYRRGGKNNDLAWCGTLSAYGAYLVLAEGREMNASQIQSVYAFIKNSILKSPDIQAASDENKQLACEILAIQATEVYRKFISEKQLGRNYQKVNAELILRDIFRALGEDIRQYKLTESGIVKITVRRGI
jgi:hypothetical protein